MKQSQGSCLYKEQIKVFHMDYTESKGPIIARANQQTLIGDEEFCLQVDAHTKFGSAWDVKLIKQWQDTGNDNGILTTYVWDIEMRTGADEGEHTNGMPHVFKTEWGTNGMVRNSQVRHGITIFCCCCVLTFSSSPSSCRPRLFPSRLCRIPACHFCGVLARVLYSVHYSMFRPVSGREEGGAER